MTGAGKKKKLGRREAEWRRAREIEDKKTESKTQMNFKENLEAAYAAPKSESANSAQFRKFLDDTKHLLAEGFNTRTPPKKTAAPKSESATSAKAKKEAASCNPRTPTKTTTVVAAKPHVDFQLLLKVIIFLDSPIQYNTK